MGGKILFKWWNLRNEKEGGEEKNKLNERKKRIAHK
jgi:hypothetical protein